MSFENFSFTDNITVLDETHSTNDVARELARQGAEEFSCVLSKRQTGGRGRMGRKFFSYDGGVYLSVVLRPDISPKDSLFITVAAAVAMAEVIEEASGKRALIKWVNDIYIDGKKVCGILTEGSISEGALQFAILGVGVNLSLPKENFPTEISDIAGSVFDYAVDEAQKNRFISLFLEKFKAFYQNLDKKEYLTAYRERNMLDGQEITYEREGKTYIGRVVGIDQNAALIVEHGGIKTALSTGEVQIRNFKRE